MYENKLSLDELLLMATTNKPIVCIYHDGCLDGTASAWVVEQFFGKDRVTFIPGKYGNPPPILNDSLMYLVDFSYKRNDVLKLRECNTVIVLDHHATAAKELEGLYEIDQTHSGAVLTWKHFFPTQDVPEHLLYIEDRDLWRFKYEHTKEWTATAFSYPIDLDGMRGIMATDPKQFIGEGPSLLRKRDSDVQKVLKSSHYMLLNGVQVPVVNVPYIMASDTGDILSRGARYAVMYSDTHDKRMFSLRSQKLGGARVDLIAEQFGGGGHPNAAGFSIAYDDPRFAESHLILNSDPDVGLELGKELKKVGSLLKRIVVLSYKRILRKSGLSE